MLMLLNPAGLAVASAALGIAVILEDRARFLGRHIVTNVCGSPRRRNRPSDASRCVLAGTGAGHDYLD